MNVTEKDSMLLTWINRMRYVTCEQVQTRFELKKTAAYWRLQRLVKAGYLRYKRVYLRKPGIYFCGSTGLLGESGLKAIPRISLLGYDHNLKVVDVSIALERWGKWTSDREYMREKEVKNKFSEDFHCPDGILEMLDKRIAVEVELTHKSGKALERILKKHRRSRDYEEVWYLVPNRSLFERLNRMVGEDPGFKVFYIQEILKESERGETNV